MLNVRDHSAAVVFSALGDEVSVRVAQLAVICRRARKGGDNFHIAVPLMVHAGPGEFRVRCREELPVVKSQSHFRSARSLTQSEGDRLPPLYGDRIEVRQKSARTIIQCHVVIGHGFSFSKVHWAGTLISRLRNNESCRNSLTSGCRFSSSSNRLGALRNTPRASSRCPIDS